jgi:hypothetical protein
MQDNLLDINDELMKLVREGINTGFGLIQEADEDITPLLITETTITVLAEQDLNQIFALIQELLVSNTIKRGALIYNGYLTLRGERSRALFAEGYEQGKDKKWCFAQVYRPTMKVGLLRKAQPPECLGNLKFLAGEGEYCIS